LTLAHCFPNGRSISIEFDSASPNAPIAPARFPSSKNVECLFGDSREMLPKLIQPNDPVLIDGSQEFRALKLALNLLRTGKPSVVFLHDYGAGRPWRKFVDRHWPGAFFSDDPDFLSRFGFLDDFSVRGRDFRRPRPTSFACLPAALPAPYHIMLAKTVLGRAPSLAPSKIRSFLGLKGKPYDRRDA
jgi:hypothetical protein